MNTNAKRTFRDRLKIMSKYFYIIALLMIICGVGTFYYVSRMPGLYISKSTILINNENNEIYYEPKTFVTHLQTRDVLNVVQDNLDLDYTYEEMLKLIEIKEVKDTKLIEITVSSDDSKLSKQIIDELIGTFQTKMLDFYPGEKLMIVENPIESNAKNYLDLEILTIIGLAIGFIIGTILVNTFGTIDVTIKNHEDLNKYLNIKSLGIVPDNVIDEEMPTKGKKKNQLKGRANIKIVTNPRSLISESYRMIRTNLDFLDLKVVNFTSTTAGEGKSESISNIAISFAIANKKVLVIDCDLRKPMLHTIFGLNRTLGLTDILLYNRINDFSEIVQKYKIPNNEQNIHVLSAGSKVFNPSELLNSKRFSELIDKVKEKYDLILIDCPPISLMTDAVVVSKLTNGTAYVIEYNRLDCAAIKNCLNQLTDINVCVLGGIITKVNIRKQGKYYGNKYEYYSNYI